jgi:hypothetical protein
MNIQQMSKYELRDMLKIMIGLLTKKQKKQFNDIIHSKFS